MTLWDNSLSAFADRATTFDYSMCAASRLLTIRVRQGEGWPAISFVKSANAESIP